jgi:hypothetical protein
VRHPWEGWSWDETVFEGTASYYRQGRNPYAPGIAEALACALGLDGQGRLLDIGCGPGTLTLLFAHLFEEVGERGKAGKTGQRPPTAAAHPATREHGPPGGRHGAGGPRKRGTGPRTTARSGGPRRRPRGQPEQRGAQPEHRARAGTQRTHPPTHPGPRRDDERDPPLAKGGQGPDRRARRQGRPRPPTWG